MVYLAENQQIHLQKHAWISMQPKTFHRLKNLIVDTSRGAKPRINFFFLSLLEFARNPDALTESPAF